jgi:hypothetical protein
MIYAPILVIIDLASHQDDENVERENEYKNWAITNSHLVQNRRWHISVTHLINLVRDLPTE